MTGMPQLSDAHRQLAKIVGDWRGEEKLHPSPWDPVGGMADARVQNRLALGGFVVVQDYEQKRGGQVTFEGHAVFRYDAQAQCYVSHWFDSMAMQPNEFRGQFVNDVMTLNMQGPMGHNRTVFDFSKPGQYTFKMEVSPDGQHWHPFMEGKYARK